VTVLLIGCGRMGGALARTWSGNERVLVHDPVVGSIPGTEPVVDLHPAEVPADAAVILAVKPQIFSRLPLAPLAGRLVVSIMAGISLAALRDALGGSERIVRAMPNTPAAIGQGITAMVAGDDVDAADRERTEALLRVAGDVIWLEREADLDAVTAISGSGPAYFFRFTEALAAAGIVEGLPEGLAMRLARATFTGAAALAAARPDSLAELRAEVTSPAGTTAAGLTALDQDQAIDRLMGEGVRRAARRSRELAG
jgi:pyrroline-5-carboxylate reductase